MMKQSGRNWHLKKKNLLLVFVYNDHWNIFADFDDMSCEMRFGEEPPLQSLDPAFAQPCYKQCKYIYVYIHI